MDTQRRVTAAQSRSAAHFFGFAEALVFPCAMFCLINFAYSQTGEPNNSPEIKPHRNYQDLEPSVLGGKILSDCSVSGSDLAKLLLNVGAGNATAQRPFTIWLKEVDIEDAVVITGSTVSIPVTFENCVFKGKVNFAAAEFLHGLEFSGCRFDGEVKADGMHIHGDFSSQGCHFRRQARVSFRDAQIDGDLTWKNIEFATQQEVDCTRISISHEALLSDVTFAGPANFEGCSVGCHLVLEHCHFNGHDEAADFSTANIQEDLLVRNSTFSGFTQWDHINARGLYFSDGTAFAQALELYGLTIHRSMSFETVQTVSDIQVMNTEIAEDLKINDLKPKNSSEHDSRSTRPGFHLIATHIGALRLPDISFSGKLDLEDDTIETLDIGTSGQANGEQNKYKLSNLTVRRFQSQASQPEALLNFINGSEFDAEIYVSLENFFTAQGETELAKQTFIKRNDRFEELLPKDGNWFVHLIAGKLTGYGKAPEYSLIPCLIVVLIGWIFFADKTKMQVNEDKFQERRYHGLWYSLDVFAPIIDLEAAKVWSPKPDQTLKWIVFRIERILGWLLVPIAIAAFTGFLHS